MDPCPVCLDNVASKRSLVMECGHTLCIKCSTRWVADKGTCPMCRRPSLLMSRTTRSRTRAQYVIKALRSGLSRSFMMECECGTGGVLCPVKELRLLLLRLVLEEKTVWRRVDMKRSLNTLKRLCNRLYIWIIHIDQIPSTILLERTLIKCLNI